MARCTGILRRMPWFISAACRVGASASGGDRRGSSVCVATERTMASRAESLILATCCRAPALPRGVGTWRARRALMPRRGWFFGFFFPVSFLVFPSGFLVFNIHVFKLYICVFFIRTHTNLIYVRIYKFVRVYTKFISMYIFFIPGFFLIRVYAYTKFVYTYTNFVYPYIKFLYICIYFFNIRQKCMYIHKILYLLIKGSVRCNGKQNNNTINIRMLRFNFRNLSYVWWEIVKENHSNPTRTMFSLIFAHNQYACGPKVYM